MTVWLDDCGSIALFYGVTPSVAAVRNLAEQSRKPLDQYLTKAFDRPSFILRRQTLGHHHCDDRKADHQPTVALIKPIEVQKNGVHLRV